MGTTRTRTVKALRVASSICFAPIHGLFWTLLTSFVWAAFDPHPPSDSVTTHNIVLYTAFILGCIGTIPLHKHYQRADQGQIYLLLLGLAGLGFALLFTFDAQDRIGHHAKEPEPVNLDPEASPGEQQVFQERRDEEAERLRSARVIASLFFAVGVFFTVACALMIASPLLGIAARNLASAPTNPDGLP